MNRTPLLVSIVLAPFALSLVACAAAEEEALGEATGMSSATVVGVGKVCRGGTKKTVCEPGLECVVKSGLGRCRVDPDAESKGAAEGKPCGGSAKIKCKDGLTCATPSSAAGARGVCVDFADTCEEDPKCERGDRKVPGPDACPAEGECYRVQRCGDAIWCTNTR